MRRECRERFPPPPISKETDSWRSRHASRHVRDACRDRSPAVMGKTFPAFPAHVHPQFYVSGKRPMDCHLVSAKPLSEPMLINSYIFVQENAFKKVCKMVSILSRPQCVKGKQLPAL